MKKQWELLNISYQELEKYKFPEYQRLKNRYVDNLIVGQRFLQKHFLYFTWFEKLNLITEKDYEKIVPRLPKSLGGDIGMVYNKNLFLECFNYGRKKTRQDLSAFDKEEE